MLQGHIMKKGFMQRLVLLLIFWMTPALLGANRPNIVFLFSDDQRFDTIGALGNSQIRTPNLDRLVREGTSFTRAYCMGAQQGAVCVPSRAMLMTGRSLFRATTKPGGGEISRETVMWPELFQQAGYATIGIGKWHNDRASYARAFSKGGPVFFGGMTDQSKIPVYQHNPEGNYRPGKQVVTNVPSSELFANAAIHFLKEQQKTNQPFVLYVAFTSPHDPRTPSGDFARMYDPAKMKLPKNFLSNHPFDNGEMKVRDEQLLPSPRDANAVRKELANYYGMISELDHHVGRILDELKGSGLHRNTIVVFASDHGLAIGSHGLLGKQNLYEHSTRAPLIFSGPGIPQNKSTAAMCYLFDVYPTLCDLAGVPRPLELEGRSQSAVIAGKQPYTRDWIFTAYRDVQRAVRNERWKLIYYPKIGKAQLFDLRKDPYETQDRAAQRDKEKIMKELQTRLGEFQAGYGDPLAKQSTR